MLTPTVICAGPKLLEECDSCCVGGSEVDMLYSFFTKTFNGIRWFGLMLIIVLVVLASPTYAASSDVVVGIADDHGQVTVEAGQLLLVRLAAQPAAGYSWSATELDARYLVQYNSTSLIGSAGVGAPSWQELRFRPLAAGTSQLRLRYGRVWQPSATDPVFQISVTTSGPTTEVAPPAATLAVQPAVVPMPWLPDAFNWCDHNGCSPVKDQGSCGSCWAFATTGVAEGLIGIADGVTRDISEQYLLSCNGMGFSCNGGYWSFDSFGASTQLASTSRGVVYEQDLPYTGQAASCSDNFTYHEQLKDWGFVIGPLETAPVDAIKQAIRDYGPVGTMVCVGPAFHQYQGGVFRTDESASCPGFPANHVMVLVGWNDQDGAWIARNSWGSGWGEQGYMRIAYGTSNIDLGVVYARYGKQPEAPEQVAAQVRQRQVELQWQVKPSGLGGVRVEQQATDGSWQPVATANPDQRSLVVPNGCQSQADYRLVAFGPGGEAQPTQTIQVDRSSCTLQTLPTTIYLPLVSF